MGNAIGSSGVYITLMTKHISQDQNKFSLWIKFCAYNLIKEGQGLLVLQSMNAFPDLGQQQLAVQMINTNQEQDLICNLGAFVF